MIIYKIMRIISLLIAAIYTLQKLTKITKYNTNNIQYCSAGERLGCLISLLGIVFTTYVWSLYSGTLLININILITGLSITATYLLIYKYIESWIIWSRVYNILCKR